MAALKLGEILIRKSEERGYFENDWLKSYHSFSFSEYYDEKHMSFGDLRVINQDWVRPQMGFPMHPHRNMEIISYIVEGTIEHQDSMGNKKQVHAGEVQVMSAGEGVVHSEYNPSKDKVLELFQIWIRPDQLRLTPRYDQKTFLDQEKANQLKLIVSKDGREGSLRVSQDINLYASVLQPGKSVEFHSGARRKLWLQQVRGSVEVAGESLQAGDALYFDGEKQIEISSIDGGEFLLFDLRQKY